MDEQRLWERCVKFHGHSCGGLMIGFRAALYAMELLEAEIRADEQGEFCLSPDEELVCIAENDACGLDAIQVLLGCSVGKGNLLFHMRGKQAFSFYHRRNQKAVRLVLKPRPQGMTREESFAYHRDRPAKALFEVKEATLPLPEKARIFQSYPCARCGEITAENMLRLCGEERLCLDCYREYDRFRV